MLEEVRAILRPVGSSLLAASSYLAIYMKLLGAPGPTTRRTLLGAPGRTTTQQERLKGIASSLANLPLRLTPRAKRSISASGGHRGGDQDVGNSVLEYTNRIHVTQNSKETHLQKTKGFLAFPFLFLRVLLVGKLVLEVLQRKVSVLLVLQSCVHMRGVRDLGDLLVVSVSRFLRSLLVTTSNKCHASSNKCLTSSNKEAIRIKN